MIEWNPWGARVAQLLLLGFFALYLVGLVAMFHDDLSWFSVTWVSLSLGIGFLIGKNALDFHDVYQEGESTFVLKQLFYTKRLAAKQIRGVREGVRSGSFYFVTAEGDFYFHFVDLQALITELTSVQSDATLNVIKQKVWEMQQASP